MQRGADRLRLAPAEGGKAEQLVQLLDILLARRGDVEPLVAHELGSPRSGGDRGQRLVTRLDVFRREVKQLLERPSLRRSIAAEAYLRATVTNTSPLLLLPGPARVFHGTQFREVPVAKLEVLPGVDMPRPVIDFLARRVTSSVRELEGALNRIGAYAMMTGRPIDVAFVEEVLANVLRANQRRISIDEIQTQVAEHYRIRKAEMTSARRAREVARPRQVAMYLSKQLTPKSLPDIGRRFGGRDHTTVLHAVRKISGERQQLTELNQQLHVLEQTLKG